METIHQKKIIFNQRGFELNDTEIRENVQKNIKNIGKFSVTSKYYTFLSKKNLSEIRDGDFRVSLSSYGKKYVLFLTTINDRKYSILINKKNESMVTCQYKFHHSLYEGTLFDGELVKNNDNKWIFIINEIAYYKGKNIIVKPFDERQELIENILTNEYLRDEEYKNMTYVVKKQFFKYEYLQDLCTRIREGLNYKNSGIYFKNVYNYSDNYLYVFPESRTDHQILHRNVNEEEEESYPRIEQKTSAPIQINKVNIKNSEDEEDDNIFGDVDVIEIKNEKVIETPTIIKNTVVENNNKVLGNNIKKENIQRKNCKFLIRPTTKPDVYELYCRSFDKHIEKYSYAGIPNMITSKFLIELFKDYKQIDDITTLIKEKKAKYVECVYYKQFKKWVPLKTCDDMDHHAFINEVSILLDNCEDEDSDDDDESDDEGPLVG